MGQLRASRRQSSLGFRRATVARALKRAMGGTLMAAPLLLAAQAAHAQADGRTDSRNYAIPAGTLEDVLGRFGRESGIMLSFKPEVTAGRMSNGLQGRYTVASGLDALLANTGIDATRQGNGSYLLTRPAPAVSAGPTTTLAPVTVSGSGITLPEAYAGGQVARGGGLGILGTTDVMDTPFSTTNYTREALDDAQARTLADVVQNESSVRLLTSSTGFGEDFQIRGFTVSSTDVGLNGLYGLASGSRMPAIIMERVEVLKGPGTLMNGMGPSGSVGGNINIVTKRAGDEPLTRVTTTYQSPGTLGSQVDVGRRFGDNNEWGIRFNGQYRDGATAIDNGNQQTTVGAVGLDYTGRKLRWSLDAYTQHEDTDNFRPQVGFASSVTDIPSPPSGHANWYPGTKLKLQDSVVASRVEYDVTDNLMVYGAVGYRYGEASQTFPSGAANQLGNQNVLNAYYDSNSNTTSTDLGMRGKFRTGAIGHTVSLDFTRLQQQQSTAYVTGGTRASNIYDPQPLAPITADRQRPSKASDTVLSSIALTDTLSFLDDRVLLTGGLRQQRVQLTNFSTATGARTSYYNEDAISPVAGLVVKPWEHVSLYGNFTSGLTRGGIAPTTAANAGEVFPPFKSKQYEAGVKVDWGRVTTTASVFQITRPNSITDPTTNIYSFDGEQRNRGFELSGYGELMDGLRFMASGTFYDATLKKTAGGVNEGNDANGVPNHTYNLGLDWDVPGVTGLSLNGRMIYTSSMYFNASNTLKMPSWTRYDLGARYRTRVMGKDVVFRATVENLFNKTYWLTSGTYATVAAPRTVLLSAQFDF
ncbi:TonB-dependent receptor [Bordetella sp. N]|uniref:TonB-dependent receptor n=1 Tax=Bordetella sp. N TaxID=1746199 RepID=UPI0009E6649E|nr:TonB-dependent receptor [Bordetella sp. N]